MVWSQTYNGIFTCTHVRHTQHLLLLPLYSLVHKVLYAPLHIVVCMNCCLQYLLVLLRFVLLLYKNGRKNNSQSSCSADEISSSTCAAVITNALNM